MRETEPRVMTLEAFANERKLVTTGDPTFTPASARPNHVRYTPTATGSRSALVLPAPPGVRIWDWECDGTVLSVRITVEKVVVQELDVVGLLLGGSGTQKVAQRRWAVGRLSSSVR